MKILLVSSEVAPFAKTGGLADVAGSLPSALKSLGCDVKVFTPYYRETKKGDFNIKKIGTVPLGTVPIFSDPFSLYHCKKGRVDFYFIEREEFFNRDFLYGTASGDYPDNAVRFAFFANAVLRSAQTLNFKPDIIHCNDWQTALIPFYLKYKLKDLDFFKDTKALFTVHNLAYQGLFTKETMPQVGVSYEFFTMDTLEFYGNFSFIKSGLLYSDAISTVSKGYAKEILTKEHGCGLEGLLSLRKGDIYGIVNGADYSQWNPETDEFIKTRYDEKSLQNKAGCKQGLLEQIKLDVHIDTPLLGVIGRLAYQKGIDIIADGMEDIIKLGCNLIILGAGEEKYQKLLTALAGKYPKNLAVRIAFDNSLAHKIEAGCDIFLMPSRYEPCGLNQMYSLKYGTIPVVRATGGLDDTIVDYTQNPKDGNGFKFKEANPESFLQALKRAVSVYKKRGDWQKLMLRAMGFDFSWKNSAQEYIKLYERMHRC